MTLHEITSRDAWESFQSARPWSQFTQSWAWGEFRRGGGCDIRRLALISQDGTWKLAAQLEFRPKRPMSGYWFAPRGPVFSERLGPDERIEAFRLFRERLSRAAGRALFLRVEPVAELGKPEGLLALPFVRNVPVNPASTVLIDLDRSRDDLLAAMKQKTRYNIRLAERHGVTTRPATRPEDVRAFFDLHEATAERDRFTTHDRAYLTEMFRTLEREGLARIRLAERDGTLLAGSLEIVYGRTTTYLHGASSADGKNLMAPYALHWDAIMQAKRDGFLTYDFWGVNPASKGAYAYKPSWEGISRFKLGWGGRRADLCGTWDLPYRPTLYFLAFPRLWWRL
ncbi:peptidoglycan bridge formation glycyltransferase FemA/FemB family protein [Candidatus Uhrbacteria bacterium]|nr:peptidoglycan bridge formation glycyltransferase FemA/FemB family protein [Candidatus Uhrbacteria bacterium]